jgi:hypothetical protein
VTQEDIKNAPDSGDAPHLSPSRGVIAAGADKPTAEEAEAAREVRRLEQAPAPEPAPEVPALPEDAYNSEAFRAANSGARDAFAQAVKRPGTVFVDHGGRYVNIFDIAEVYDAEPGTIVPEGLFLFPVNYLVREDERQAHLRG